MAAMISLVHHALDAEPGAISPFVQHIHNIAEGSDLCIAGPYLRVRVLDPILRKAKTWRLLTDAEELLRSHARCERAEMVKLLVDHGKHVRHWPDLHAKVVIGNTHALVGSANLTAMGLGQRQEMAIALEDPDAVARLRTWFDALWERCTSPSPMDLEAFSSSLPAAFPEVLAVRIPSPAPKVSALVVSRELATRTPDTTGEGRLIERLALGASREWIEAFLSLCAELVEALGTVADDPRLAMTLPNTERGVLRVNLNQREVLSAHRHNPMSIGLILPQSVDLPPDLAGRIVHQYEFRPASDGKWFAYFSVEEPRLLAPLRDSWLFAITDEGARQQRRSSFRQHHHVPAFLGSVTDLEYRQRLLDAAFPKRAWWFGLNNGTGGHMQLAGCQAFLDGQQEYLVWPVGDSKPKKLYAEMRTGDRVLFWTGHGTDPRWGLIGTAEISSTSQDKVVLHRAHRFASTLTPYPKGNPDNTPEVTFLLETFGDDFSALGDVRRAVFGTERRPPVTVAAIAPRAVDAVAFRAESPRT